MPLCKVYKAAPPSLQTSHVNASNLNQNKQQHTNTMLALPLLSSLSTISAVAAAPTILRSQLQVYPGGRCLDNPHGELYEGHLVQWWDCAGIDPNRQGLVNPNQGWRPDGQKWRYIADENWCLGCKLKLRFGTPVSCSSLHCSGATGSGERDLGSLLAPA